VPEGGLVSFREPSLDILFAIRMLIFCASVALCNAANRSPTRKTSQIESLFAKSVCLSVYDSGS